MPLRPMPLGLALAMWRVWRRLPAAQRRQLLQAARTHGPRLAQSAMQRRRARRFP
jgi:hypothetical protein